MSRLPTVHDQSQQSLPSFARVFGEDMTSTSEFRALMISATPDECPITKSAEKRVCSTQQRHGDMISRVSEQYCALYNPQSLTSPANCNVLDASIVRKIAGHKRGLETMQQESLGQRGSDGKILIEFTEGNIPTSIPIRIVSNSGDTSISS
jgi:hypothetical protein